MTPVTFWYRRAAHLALVAGCAALLFSACQPRYDELPTYSPEHHLLQVVVETPAGTNRELRYSPADNDFRPVQRAGADYLVPFLPYPANVGFVPATRVSATPTRPAHPQPALVLAEAQPPGTVLEVLPIGLLLLDRAGELENMLVTVPARPRQQILPVTSWQELTDQYPAARDLLRLWYQHSAPGGQVRVAGWRDEQAAVQLLQQVQRK